jgi:AcrR family transcriptional regulator
MQSDHGASWSGTLSLHRRAQAERIAAAAMSVVARDGLGGLSMSAIADAAGVSRQTLYKYFPDVDSVLLEMARLSEAVDQDLADRIAAAPDGAAGLRAFVEAVLTASASGHPSPAALAAMLPPAARADLAGHARRSEQLVADVLRRGASDGSLHPGLEPELDGPIVYATVWAAAGLAERPDVDAERLRVHVIDDILRMVAPEAA